MESVLVELAQALRERLAIIHNDESRRNADAHMARLRTVSEKIEELQAALPQTGRCQIGALSSASQLRQSARIPGKSVAALTAANAVQS
jgi:hypothetical protein